MEPKNSNKYEFRSCNGSLFTFMAKLTRSDIFNQTILGFIVLASVMVGVQSYDSLENAAAVVVIDYIILGVFTFEVVAKMLAEGTRPWRYFTGAEWRWNAFDFVIVLFCMPFIPVNSGSIAFLRLMRLMRVTKLFKWIPELRVIVVGMLLGMKSIVYIMMLLVLAFYLFAVLAVFLFRENDPGNFGGMASTTLTLFRCSTLDDWTDLMYINMFGCDEYDAGLYFPANSTRSFSTLIGSFNEFTCVSPTAQYSISFIFFVSFTVISAFVVLSLFIGAITLSMSEVLDEQRQEKKRQKIASVVSPEWLWDTMNKALEDKKMGGSELKKTRSFNKKTMTFNRKAMQDLRKRAQAQQGKPKKINKLNTSQSSAFLLNLNGDNDDEVNPLEYYYLQLSYACHKLAKTQQFEGLMFLTIVLAGILVGVSTTLDADDCTLCIADNLILGIFTFEVIVKIIGEGRKPYRYILDPWNRFDFVIIFSSYLPMLLGAEDIRSMITTLRLLKILRVLKLVSKFKQLKIVVEALLKGFSSISYITVMMLVLFFMFAIVGMLLFKENDPWHFGVLPTAMLTLFRCATLEDWTDVMYINMWGCDRYGYDSMPEDCTSPLAWGWLATVYFVFFAVIGSMVLVTLFLGVVTTSMEQASIRQKMEDDLKDEIADAKEKHNITDFGVRILYNAFHLLDEDDGGTLEASELSPMFEAVQEEYKDFNFHKFIHAVDKDRSGEIDFAEFLHLMILIREWVEEHNIPTKVKFGASLRDSVRRVSKSLSSLFMSPANAARKYSVSTSPARRDSTSKSKANANSSSPLPSQKNGKGLKALVADFRSSRNSESEMGCKDEECFGFSEEVSQTEQEPLSSKTPRVYVVDHSPVYDGPSRERKKFSFSPKFSVSPNQAASKTPNNCAEEMSTGFTVTNRECKKFSFSPNFSVSPNQAASKTPNNCAEEMSPGFTVINSSRKCSKSGFDTEECFPISPNDHAEETSPALKFKVSDRPVPEEVLGFNRSTSSLSSEHIESDQSPKNGGQEVDEGTGMHGQHILLKKVDLLKKIMDHLEANKVSLKKELEEANASKVERQQQFLSGMDPLTNKSGKEKHDPLRKRKRARKVHCAPPYGQIDNQRPLASDINFMDQLNGILHGFSGQRPSFEQMARTQQIHRSGSGVEETSIHSIHSTCASPPKQKLN